MKPGEDQTCETALQSSLMICSHCIQISRLVLQLECLKVSLQFSNPFLLTSYLIQWVNEREELPELDVSLEAVDYFLEQVTR